MSAATADATASAASKIRIFKNTRGSLAAVNDCCHFPVGVFQVCLAQNCHFLIKFGSLQAAVVAALIDLLILKYPIPVYLHKAYKQQQR